MMASGASGGAAQPRVLISYAHESPQHEDAVRRLWVLLRENGIDARVDLTAAEARQDWTLWMLEQVRDADHVLVVASPAYRRRADGLAVADEGRGVQWEAALIRDAVYRDRAAGLRRFLPVLLPGATVDEIPLFMNPTATTHYLVTDFSVAGAERLLRVLSAQPYEVDVPLGAVPFLPSRATEPAQPPVGPDVQAVEAASTAARSITLLHLSDVRFGKNHVFGGAGLTDADEHLDSLFGRLHADLDHLRQREGLAPQVLVVSGDLAERGLQSELYQAERCLTELTRHLGLPPQRVVVVPGNHDINWRLCEAYFNQSAGEEKEPQAPYWPKWQSFAAMFGHFYTGQNAVRFEMERPYTLFDMPDLGLVVAGLNSTIAESHRREDHHGWVGEAQLRWFADLLRERAASGWLRVGVVHHNVLRGAQDDDGNLRDAGDLERILGPHLDLLLHGHTHDAKLGRLASGLVVLSTGSAALKPGSRPPDVPNQYQVLRIETGRIRRWARRYQPDQRRWVGDTRASDDGSDWRATIPTTFSAPREEGGRARAPAERERHERPMDDQAGGHPGRVSSGTSPASAASSPASSIPTSPR